MKIKANEITNIYAHNTSWLFNGEYNEVLNYTTYLLSQISVCDMFHRYDITEYDYIKIIDKLTKRFSYNKEV